MKRLLMYAAAAAMAMCCCARDTNRYDSVVTDGGIEYSQRGGLGPSNFVVTAVSVPKLVSSMTNDDSIAEFSAAVSLVAPSGKPAVAEAEALIRDFESCVSGGSTNVTQRRKTELLGRLVDYLRKKEGVE